MSNLWQRIRCRFFEAHRWEEKTIDGEKAFECHFCHKRYFGPHPPEGDIGAFGSGSPGM